MTMVSPYSTSPSVKVESDLAPRPAPAAAPGAAVKPKSKPRKRVNTAEKRHQHNAIERQRRETLNGKFLSLARLLPSLASHRRPSKSAIVNGSIAHLTHQRNQRLLAASILKKLTAERDELFREVNDWRKANGYAPKEGVAAAWTDEMDEICAVENETFGNFASFDESAEDDEEETEGMNLEQATAIAGAFTQGLITPRASTDASSAAPIPAPNWATAAAADLNNFLPLSFDSVDASSTSSPLGSHPNILTPLSVEMYTHTPSPRSSASEPQPRRSVPPTAAPAPATAPILPSSWTAEQMIAFQQQVQQQQFQRQQQQAALAAQHQAAVTFGGLQFNGMFPPTAFPTASAAAPAPSTDAFAQIMATMFPQQRDLTPAAATTQVPSVPDVNQWRKFAMTGLLPGAQEVQPSLDDIKNAVRTGMGLGMGMQVWSENQVEGY